MKMLVVRAAAFVVGSSIAGCVYATHTGSDTAGAATSPRPAIAVYPGARHTVGNPSGDGADVEVHLAVVSLHIEAARYDSADGPVRVVDFYRKALAKSGHVTVAKGGPHTHVQGFSWTSAPDQTTVAAGHDIVAVEPHGSGSEFAIIRIDAQPGDATSGH